MTDNLSISSSSSKVAAVVVAGIVGMGAFYYAIGGGNKKKDKTKKEDDEEGETWASKIPTRHSPLEEIYPNRLYRVEASGCDYGPPSRNMTIYRIPSSGGVGVVGSGGDDDNNNNNNDGDDKKKKNLDDKLIIISAIAVPEDTMDEILKLGTPTVLWIPNTMHRDCAKVWKKRFPNMIVVCPNFSHPPNGIAKVEEIGIKVDMTTDQLCQLTEYKDWLTPKRIDGWVHFEEILEVHFNANKKAMIVTDLLFTMPRIKNGGFISDFIQWIFDSSIDMDMESESYTTTTNNNNNNNKVSEPSSSGVGTTSSSSAEDEAEAEKVVHWVPIPKVSRVARIFGIKDWKKAENWYRSYAKQNGQNIFAILVGHGPPILQVNDMEGCQQSLVGIADQLIKPRW